MSFIESVIIPKDVLFGNPVKTSPQISPDGTKMAYLAPINNVLNVWTGVIGEDDSKAVTFDTDRGIHNYFWAQDNRHIMYLQDANGNENWRLFAVDLETNDILDFTPFPDVQVQVLSHDKHFPDELLLGINKDNPALHDVYHLQISTGKLEKIVVNPGNVAGWQPDTNMKIRGSMVGLSDGGLEFHVRENDDSEWKKLVTWNVEDSLNSSPVSFSKDGKYVYLIDSRNVNSGRLVKVEIETGNIEVIAEDPNYDVSSVMAHPDTHEIQMVSFTKARVENIVLDKSIKADVDAISELDHGDFFIYDRDDSDKTWLVGYSKDNGPVSYYSYNRESKSATFLFYNKPKLNDYSLAEMEPISFKARDGLTVHGYVTFPPGKEKKNLPVVLNVHGGPWWRDTWGFNSEAQWMANRGYICLQINYRGSTGYGKEFLNAGDKEWGGKMHDDLLDAIEWIVETGFADRKNIAIYGGSYGGYAALVGATFTPDVFKCAVDIVGPSSIITLIQNIPPYWEPMIANFKNRVGDPEKDEEFLKSISPLFKVDNIKIPVLVAQGANDPRVKQVEAEQIVEAMKKKGIDYEYILFPDEGHGFLKPENKIKFYTIAEKFLAKHLGGRFEENGD